MEETFVVGMAKASFSPFHIANFCPQRRDADLQGVDIYGIDSVFCVPVRPQGPRRPPHFIEGRAGRGEVHVRVGGDPRGHGGKFAGTDVIFYLAVYLKRLPRVRDWQAKNRYARVLMGFGKRGWIDTEPRRCSSFSSSPASPTPGRCTC